MAAEPTAMPAPFRAGFGLRNAHVQTVLASSFARRALVRWRARELRRRARDVLLDAGDGVRLAGRYSAQDRLPKPRGLAVLLHGWEGSIESSYVLETGTRLLDDGWDVLRLNFRDHGGTHALNAELFHSCRIDEVMGALLDVEKRFPLQPRVLVGYSLGGNFALRAAVRAPAAGLSLSAVIAVCPVIDPQHSMLAIEASPNLYERYFLHKWRGSLQLKQRAFPESAFFERAELRLGLRELTRVLVERHTSFATLDAYLDGYAITGDRLAALRVPAHVLTARDDPVIPIADFATLAENPAIGLDVMEHGGHCGFIAWPGLRSYCTEYVANHARRVGATAD